MSDAESGPAWRTATAAAAAAAATETAASAACCKGVTGWPSFWPGDAARHAHAWPSGHARSPADDNARAPGAAKPAFIRRHTSAVPIRPPSVRPGPALLVHCGSMLP